MSTCSVASTSSAARIPSGAAVRPIPGRSGQILRKRDAVEDRLGAGLGLAVVDAGAVQHQHRASRTVLDVVKRDFARSSLPPASQPRQELNGRSRRASARTPTAKVKSCRSARSAPCRGRRRTGSGLGNVCLGML